MAENDKKKKKDQKGEQKPKSVFQQLMTLWGGFVFGSSLIGVILLGLYGGIFRTIADPVPRAAGPIDMGATLPELREKGAEGYSEEGNAEVRWARLESAQIYYELMCTDYERLRKEIAGAWAAGDFEASSTRVYGPERDVTALKEATQKWLSLRAEPRFYDSDKITKYVAQFRYLRDVGSKRIPEDEATYLQLIELSKKPIDQLCPESTWNHYAWLKWVYGVVTGYEWKSPKFYR